jgi:hypothetical protein
MKNREFSLYLDRVPSTIVDDFQWRVERFPQGFAGEGPRGRPCLEGYFAAIYCVSSVRRYGEAHFTEYKYHYM